MDVTGRIRYEDAEIRAGRRHGLRPHGSVRTPRNRDPREAGWVLPVAPISDQQRKADQMSTLLLHRDPKTIVPDLVDWFEEPFLTLRPYLGQPIKIEEYVEGDHYLIRAELAGIDPEKDVEIMVGSGYLTIRAERSDKIERKHRSEFRYGSFSRTLSLPVSADEDAVTASYHDGILTISVGLKAEQKASAKKIEVTKDKIEVTKDK
jgi:HSP20 family protein